MSKKKKPKTSLGWYEKATLIIILYGAALQTIELIAMLLNKN